MIEKGQLPVTHPRSNRISLELPFFSEREARLRGIDPNLGRLIVVFADHKDPATAAAAYLGACRPKGRTIYVSAIGEFVPLSRVIKKAQAPRIDPISGSQFARISDEAGLAFAFGHWKAEQLVVVFAAEDPIQLSIPSESKWWKWSPQGNEARFLNNLAQFDPVIFYSETLTSLEIIGSQAAVLTCFETARTLIN